MGGKKKKKQHLKLLEKEEDVELNLQSALVSS